MLHSSFNVMRNYVREGLKANYPLICIKNKAILADERFGNKRRSGYIVTVNWAADKVSIVAQISLLNWATYCVCLANEYAGEHRKIKRGHFFNSQEHTIIELGTIY